MSTTGQVSDEYDASFFAQQIQGSIRSASVVVPLVLSFLPNTRSAIDVGCGAGGWLSMFNRHGVEEIFGIDGYAPDGMLQIPSENFQQVDLNSPFNLSRRFDLAMTLEVAEHLLPERGPSFVGDLCDSADVVLFGAAVPGQGGTMHIHEQWQGYWSRLFLDHGYECFDVLRPRLWSDTRVEWWYAQNTLLFVKKDRVTDFPGLQNAERVPSSMINIPHPMNFAWRAKSDEDLRARLAELITEVPTQEVTITGTEENESSALLVRENIELTERNQALSAEIATVNARCQSLVTSSSWHLTKPARVLANNFPAVQKVGRRARAAIAKLLK